MQYDFWNKWYLERSRNKNHISHLLLLRRSKQIRRTDFYSIAFRDIPHPGCRCEDCRQYRKQTKIKRWYLHRRDKISFRRPFWLYFKKERIQ